ncbi:MAG: hypothetical protein AAGE03_04410 [Pseudomonadota bacterium]
MGILTFLLRVPGPIRWGAALVGLILLAYTFGGLNRSADLREEDRRDYDQTLGRIEGATGGPADADAARNRLREAYGPWPGDL